MRLSYPKAAVLVVVVDGLVGLLDGGHHLDVELLDVGFEELVRGVVEGVGGLELLDVGEDALQFLEDLEEHVLGPVAPLAVQQGLS